MCSDSHSMMLISVVRNIVFLKTVFSVDISRIIVKYSATTIYFFGQIIQVYITVHKLANYEALVIIFPLKYKYTYFFIQNILGMCQIQ